MKQTARRVRRKSSSSREGSFFKKGSEDNSFFGEAVMPSFFMPGAQKGMQRKCAECEEEDKKVMTKSEGNGASMATSSVNVVPGGGVPLSGEAKQFFNSRMGYDFSDVQIHTGSEAENSAAAMHAKAYTIGNHIVFNRGQYDAESNEGKKLLAHELAHVVQQDEKRISRKGEEEDCGEEINLEGLTDAVYNKGAGKTVGEKKKKVKDCEDCEDDCVQVTGKLRVPYTVKTTVSLPAVPDGLRPCQKQRVAAGIRNKLAPHEQQHVAAFKTFNGSPMLPINYKGCDGGYDSYLEDLAQTEFERRKEIADKKSAALDPFSVDVDLCCKDKPKKK